MKRRFMILVVVVASACTRSQPTAPTSVPPATTYVTRRFSGIVLTEDGRPVSGATVFIGTSATTDGNGFYQLALNDPAQSAGTTSAKVTHPLYDDTVNIYVPWAPSQTDVMKDFRLYRSVMAAGDSSHLAITRDNSEGGDEGEFLYRKVHVTVPSSGTLALDTIADDPSNAFSLTIGDLPDYPVQTHASRSIDRATTLVVVVSGPPKMVGGVFRFGGFTLKTALTP
jgi:hypothetical protein